MRETVERVAQNASEAEVEAVAGTEAMDASSGQVSQTISSVAAVSEQTAAGAEELSATLEEIAASAQELSDMSEGLDTLVSRFRIEAHGSEPHGEEPRGSHLRLAA